MTRKSIRIALITKDKAAQSFYRKCLSVYEDVVLEVYSRIENFRAESPAKLYSGFIVDLRTLIRSSASEKNFFYPLFEAFPVIRVTRKLGSESFSGLILGENLGHLKGRALFDVFINLCRDAPQREIRFDIRRKIYLSTYLSFAEEFQHEEPIRAIISNISKGGCSVITNHEIQKGSNIWVVLPEMRYQRPIHCEIRWVKPWKPDIRYLPRLGGKFIRITDNQLEELFDILKD